MLFETHLQCPKRELKFNEGKVKQQPTHPWQRQPTTGPKTQACKQEPRQKPS